jgi:uncharacterized protein YbjT (DUF2867 family)
MILVIGATGPTGRAATKELLARGEPVRAVTRDREKAAAIPELAGAEIVIGDPANPDEVRSLFAGVDKLYLVPPTVPDWHRMQSALIDAARAAGITHAVRISAIGADPGEPSMSLRYHWQGEQDLERSGMAYTHVRANSFCQNLLRAVGTIRGDGKLYNCFGQTRVGIVDTRDVGEVVAKALTEDGHRGQTYELTGSEAITFDEIAERLSAAVGYTVEYVDMPVTEYETALQAAGLPEWWAKELADINGRGFYGAGGCARVTSTIEELLGRPPRSFDDFARDYADAFR